MNSEMTHQSLNEYGFTAYEFPAEVSDAAELQQIDLDFCKYAQATGTNYIEMCKRVAMIHAKLARAGRYGGGQWLAWIEARGLIAIQQIIANSRRNGTSLHSPAE